jgi:uncharacterized membrane protein (UPF0127 family)
MTMRKPRRSRGFDLVVAVCLIVACVIAVRHLAVRPAQPARTDSGLKWTRLDPVATVEIADTDATRQHGLMERDSLDTDNGMYFTYPTNHRTGFWMRNTTLKLSIAFIRQDGVIIDIKDMQPLDETTVGPDVQYRDALEMNQGWFKRNGIQVGDRTELRNGKVSFWPLHRAGN